MCKCSLIDFSGCHADLQGNSGDIVTSLNCHSMEFTDFLNALSLQLEGINFSDNKPIWGRGGGVPQRVFKQPIDSIVADRKPQIMPCK